MEKMANKHLSKWQILMGLGIALLCIYFVAKSEYGGKPAEESRGKAKQVAEKNKGRNMFDVTYEVIGTPDLNTLADVTYTNFQGGTEQTEVSLPWSKSFTVKRGQHLYISGQNKSQYGIIQVRILVNGEVWRVALSDGAYCIASSDGLAGSE
jgi:hypothetical protein